jgi:tetratricopeptide (TPR) repeat protein
LRAYANADAVEAATRGLELLKIAPSSTVELEAELHGARADAADRLGDRERQSTSIAALIELARRHERGELLRDALRREIELAHVVSDRPRAQAALAALSREIGPQNYRWRAEFHKATALLAIDRADFETTLRAGAAAIELYRFEADPRGEFDTLLILIEARNRTNRYEENRADLLRASEIAQAAGDPIVSARLLESAMTEPFMKQEFPKVHRMAAELLELSRSIGNRLGEGKAYQRSAQAAKCMFAIAEAIDGHSKALAIYKSVGDLRGSRTVENNWGSLEVALGMIARGRERLTGVLRAAEAEGDLRHEYFAASNLGLAAYFEGDFATAKRLELRALLLAQRLSSEALEALVLGDLGAAELELGEGNLALAHVEQAVAIHRRLDQRVELSTNLARLALVCSVGGEAQRAREIARELLERERAYPELVEDPAQVLWDVAQALHVCGDDREAREVAERAAWLQEARLATIDLPEYRESAAGLRWYRILVRACSADVWPER